MIRLRGVWKSYGGVAALRDLSLQVAAGEGALLTGPSGAGKSTLLRLLFAAERADRGQVTVAGRDVARLRRSSIPYLRRNVGVVFQDFKLLKQWTVRENVALAVEILNLPRAAVAERVAQALAEVGLGHKADQPAGTLSGGEQQRVAVARAVVGEPPIVLADEPTGNLDAAHGLELLELFERLRRGGTTVVTATHDPDLIRFATAHGWRRFRLDRGELVEAGPLTPHEALDCAPTDRTHVSGADAGDAGDAGDGREAAVVPLRVVAGGAG